MADNQPNFDRSPLARFTVRLYCGNWTATGSTRTRMLVSRKLCDATSTGIVRNRCW